MQAKVLNQEPPTVEQSRASDCTVVPHEDIDTEAGPQLEHFKVHVMGENYVPGQGKGVGKWLVGGQLQA